MSTMPTTTVELTSVGNSLGIVLPKELLERLHVSEGDTLHVTETSDGVKLTPHDAEFAKQLAVAEGVIQKRREVLKRLAE